jgi:hypothetical protein
MWRETIAALIKNPAETTALHQHWGSHRMQLPTWTVCQAFFRIRWTMSYNAGTVGRGIIIII